jgi:hypothetical protein
MIFNRRFGGTYIELQVRISACCLLHAGCVLGLLFDPEDGNVPPKCPLTFTRLIAFYLRGKTSSVYLIFGQDLNP